MHRSIGSHQFIQEGFLFGRQHGLLRLVFLDLLGILCLHLCALELLGLKRPLPDGGINTDADHLRAEEKQTGNFFKMANKCVIQLSSLYKVSVNMDVNARVS